MPNPFHAPYTVTQGYGPTKVTAEPAFRGYPNYHMGIDLVGPSWNAPIYPVSSGTVFACGRDTDGANYVIVQSGADLFIAYWHLSAITCSRGQSVDLNTQIGNQGSTGNSTAPHLHLEVQQKQPYGSSLHTPCNPIDPSPYLSDTAQGGAFTDMDPQEIMRGVYRILDPNYHPSDDVIDGAAARIQAEGKIDGVLKDILASKPWRTPQDADVYAIEAYATADHQPDPHGFAANKVLAGAAPVQVFSEVLTALHGQIADQGQQIIDLEGELSHETAVAEQAQQQPEIVQQTPAPTANPSPVEAPTAPAGSAVAAQVSDCQQQADMAVQIALERAEANPWPLVVAWMRKTFTWGGEQK